MKLSPFQIVILAIFGACGVAGVLVFALLVTNSSGGSTGPVVIWGTLDGTALTNTIHNAAENDPRLSQVSYERKDPLTYEQDLTNALASGTGPDIFILTQEQAVHDSGKAYQIPFKTLSQDQFRTTFIEGASPYLASEGVVALPILADPLVMFWNRDMLSSAGYVNPPAYWDELSGFAKKISKHDDSGSLTRQAIAFGQYKNVNHAKDIIALLVTQAGGKITMRDNTGNLVPALSVVGSGAAGRPAENALLFYTEFTDPSKVDYSWNGAQPNSQSAFANGDLALYFGYASEAAAIQRVNPNLSFGIAAIPQVRGGDAMSTARVYALASARTSKNLNGAVMVAIILAGHDFATALSEAVGIPGARRDVLQVNSSAPQSPEIAGLVRGGVCGAEDPVVCSAGLARSWIDPNPDKTEAIFRAMIESVISGSTRIRDALSRADQAMADVIEQQ